MFIEVPDETTADGEVAEWYEQQRASWGYLPNYAPAFATRPDVARAWNELNGAVRNNMDRRRYELATIAAARVYRSTYCTAAHSKFLRDQCGDEASMRAVAADPTGAALDATDREVVTFATRVAENAASITADDVVLAVRSLHVRWCVANKTATDLLQNAVIAAKCSGGRDFRNCLPFS